MCAGQEPGRGDGAAWPGRARDLRPRRTGPARSSEQVPTSQFGSVQFSSLAQSCPTLGDPMDCSTPGFLVHYQLPELTQTHVHRVGDAIQPSILCYPLLLLPSIFPSIRVFSNESVLRIRWPGYWSFSFSISPSNEYSGLISFRMDWLDLLAVQGALKSLLQHHSLKASILCIQLSLFIQLFFLYLFNTHIHT